MILLFGALVPGVPGQRRPLTELSPTLTDVGLLIIVYHHVQFEIVTLSATYGARVFDVDFRVLL